MGVVTSRRLSVCSTLVEIYIAMQFEYLVGVTICCKNTAPWVSVLCLWYSDMHDADSALLLPGARLRPAPAPLSIYTPAAAAPQQLSKTMRPIIIKVSTSLIFGFPCFCMQFIVCRKRKCSCIPTLPVNVYLDLYQKNMPT